MAETVKTSNIGEGNSQESSVEFSKEEIEKCSFYLHPCEGSAVQILTQGKLSAPRILRTQKVINYVKEKMVLDKPIDNLNTVGTFAPGIGGQLQHSAVGDGSFRSGLKPRQKLRPSVLSPDMSLPTVRAYIWKKPEDLVLNYRVIQGSVSVAGNWCLVCNTTLSDGSRVKQRKAF
ncbi:hypothetical protein GOBAR_AA15841 [Gossypium barbadense]|uniref:Uncharacterized protein n=1 Tax=Gossypium barbadense TaxID=3634 RepID=A0A2P5XND6_GOSBA|nr:hypothetical protein GOBAR_AA15841 [Gossypium barbadense]